MKPAGSHALAIGMLMAALVVAGCSDQTNAISSGSANPVRQVTALATAFRKPYFHADYGEAKSFVVPEARQQLQILDGLNLGDQAPLTSDDWSVANVKVNGSSATFNYEGTFCSTATTQTGSWSGSDGPGQSVASTSTAVSPTREPRECKTYSSSSDLPPWLSYRAVKGTDGIWLVDLAGAS